MKIFIVTDGQYSDYHIVAVFLSKEKAEHYAKYNSGYYDSCRVEEYDTSDDGYIISPGEIQVEVEFEHRTDAANRCHVLFNAEKAYYVEAGNGIPSNTRFSEPQYNNISYKIVRCYKEEVGEDTEFYLSKARKIGYDLGAQISNWIAEGYGYHAIKEMLEKGKEKYDD